MTKARISTAVISVAAAACLAAGAAFAGSDVAPKTYKFSATYAGKSVVTIVDNNATIQSTAGVGTASLPVGKSKLSGAGKGLGSDPCGTFGGLGAITAAKGKINFTIAPTGGSACGDESGQSFTVSGRATFKGGTGKFVKAKGSFKFAGTFTRATGAFTVKFVGTLTV